MFTYVHINKTKVTIKHKDMSIIKSNFILYNRKVRSRKRANNYSAEGCRQNNHLRLPITKWEPLEQKLCWLERRLLRWRCESIRLSWE